MPDDVTIKRKKLADYIQNSDNPVKHSPRNFGIVVDSIGSFGALRSGVSSKGKILAGNLTWEAMAEAGIEDVLEVTTNGKAWVIVNREDLSPEQERQAAYADQRTSELADWDAAQIVADLEAGVDLDGMWTDGEIAELIEEVLEGQEQGDEQEPVLARWDVPDALWATDNEWGVPLLDVQLQAQALDLPVTKWGTVRRTNEMRGTWHFYTDDYKFRALWDDPSGVVNSACANVIEPNFSTNDQMPRAVVLWGIYRKRWLARYWQSFGIRMFVDLEVCPRCSDLSLLGVPEGWRSYATRWYDAKGESAVAAQIEQAKAHAGANSVLFVVVGGRDKAEEFCKQQGVIWVKEHAGYVND